MTPCVEHGGYRNKDGYGRVRVGEKMVLAHRAAYERAIGPIPAGMYVLHSCDNPACVNPDHLRVGSQKENAADAVRKGRNTVMRGERNAAAKLTRPQVEEIRRLIGMVPGKDIAVMYGITPGRVSQIKLRQTWV